jgi:hypothetical protein
MTDIQESAKEAIVEAVNEPIYRANEKGYLVPEHLIKPVDMMRDDLVLQLIKGARHVSSVAQEFKNSAFKDVQAFVELSAEKYKVKIGGKKGNLSLYSFDGKHKVQVAQQDRIAFDERLKAAKALIDICIEKWSEGGNSNLIALIHDAFNVDKEGNLDHRRILSLRRVEIDDEDWKNAMQAISDAVKVVGSTEYMRFFERDEKGKYQSIAMDFSGL